MYGLTTFADIPPTLTGNVSSTTLVGASDIKEYNGGYSGQHPLKTEYQERLKNALKQSLSD